MSLCLSMASSSTGINNSGEINTIWRRVWERSSRMDQALFKQTKQKSTKNKAGSQKMYIPLLSPLAPISYFYNHIKELLEKKLKDDLQTAN